MDVLGLDEVLTTTRAVRRRLDLTRPVPQALLEECLDLAFQAPSGSAQNDWHWMIVRDVNQRRQIGKIYQEIFAEYAASPNFEGNLYPEDPVAHARQQRVGRSAQWLATHLAEVPVLLIPCIQIGGPLNPGNQAGLWGQLLPAAWSFALAARSRGLGTAWTTMHLRREEEVAQILDLPERVHQGVLMPVAYYTGDTFKRAWRPSVASAIHIDTW